MAKLSEVLGLKTPLADAPEVIHWVSIDGERWHEASRRPVPEDYGDLYRRYADQERGIEPMAPTNRSRRSRSRDQYLSGGWERPVSFRKQREPAYGGYVLKNSRRRHSLLSVEASLTTRPTAKGQVIFLSGKPDDRPAPT